MLDVESLGNLAFYYLMSGSSGHFKACVSNP